jgi:hypothetical protein
MKWLGLMLGLPIIILIIMFIWIVEPIKSFKRAKKSFKMIVKGEVDD